MKYNSNSLLIGGIVLVAVGFILGDAAGANLIASIGTTSIRDAQSTVPPSRLPTGADACKAVFKQAETEYRVAMRDAKTKYDQAVKNKNLCLKNAQSSRLPSPSRSVSPTPLSAE